MRRKPGTAPIINTCEAECPNPLLSGPCLLFQGAKTGGYGQVVIGKKLIYVHRYVWEQARGPIPKGMMIDHQCRNRGCCNVEHLRIVTNKINTTENVIGSAWQLNAAKTVCRNGHPYDKDNTYYRKDRNSRECRACHSETQKRRKSWEGGEP